jgi:tRNA(Ile2) C34 agmatinyltransferase TiaS
VPDCSEYLRVSNNKVSVLTEYFHNVSVLSEYVHIVHRPPTPVSAIIKLKNRNGLPALAHGRKPAKPL